VTGSARSNRWSLVSLLTDGRGSSPRIGVQRVGRGEVRVPDLLRPFKGVLEVVQQWETVVPGLRELDPDDGELVAGVRLGIPLAFPPKVLCSGPNFTDHLAEMGESGLGEAWTGYFFFKPPTTALVGPADPVLVGPDWERDRVDWEGELAVVVGRGGRDIAAADALEHVAGYSVANDISLRGPHRRDTPAAPFVWDWTASKAADTSLPLGPGLVPVWQVPDPQQLSIKTWVNGTIRQNGTTADMVLGVAELIRDASALVTLEPGDVLITGTPAGVGASSGTFLRPGDVVDVEIEGVGRLSNRIALRQDTARQKGSM